ncbi:magnesium transporter [Alkalithermobacter thermoalcaliphilus JW-YL-7 = DSM 7308]|uniref:Magnesium transporter MgtE n=1 Tax=Alkalithermobacter thermoalcaliphilus JW-YL-7 = DSM 7308 TaxID=1121328 RepID=A0A150FQS6_CLOPD|nr:magnesium transporter [[Clostridium] paradoxum JW-YL-7 = DSM 7308]SHK52752.1 magnesium transporter [[Clostridium] paradoxum JW-YL-7 = DSM 7308]
MRDLIINLIREKKFTLVRDEIVKMKSVDIAELLSEIDDSDSLIVFRLLPKDLAVEVFSYLHNEKQKAIINLITDKEIQHIMDELYFDDMIDFLEEMPASIVKKILKNAKEDERALINQFLNYPENSAGSLMTIEYLSLKKEMTLKQALEHIKRTGFDKETIYTCYVIDANRKLQGTISLRKLVTGEEDKTIEEVMNTDIIYVTTHDDQEKVAHLFKKYDLIAIPVVDKEHRLIGIITIDDIMDVIDKENTEDFQKMAAMEPSEEAYLETNTFTLAKHRTTWLLVLMISATFTGRIIRSFEDVLESVVVLAAFIPMLMDTAGNAGSQSSTLIIRGLALEQIKIKDFTKVIWKELKIGSLVGIALSVVNLVRIYYFEKMDMKIGIVVASTLYFTVVLAKLLGGLLPIAARKLKLDPALMAGPLITTIVDALALIVYFSMARLLLGI